MSIEHKFIALYRKKELLPVTDLMWHKGELVYIRSEKIGGHKDHVENFDKNIILFRYTGLKDGKDKDEQEIYEGHVVKKHIKDCQRTETFEVKWEDKHCGFNISNGKHHWYEILGHIYTDPDLLKKNEKL